METDSTDRFVPKDLPVYSWHNKQEGKDQYARFVKELIAPSNIFATYWSRELSNVAWANTLEPNLLMLTFAKN